VTPEKARQVAREQNDRDHAAGLLPSRYVEDEAVLAKVARLVLASGSQDTSATEPENADGAPSSATRRRHAAAAAAQRERATGARPG